MDVCDGSVIVRDRPSTRRGAPPRDACAPLGARGEASRTASPPPAVPSRSRTPRRWSVPLHIEGRAEIVSRPAPRRGPTTVPIATSLSPSPSTMPPTRVGRRAERQADAELSHPPVRRVRNHAVHADHAEQQRGDAGDRDEQHRETHASGRVVHQRAEGADVRRRDAAVELLHDLLNRRRRGQLRPTYHVLHVPRLARHRGAVGREPVAVAQEGKVHHRHVAVLDALPVHVADDANDRERRRRRAGARRGLTMRRPTTSVVPNRLVARRSLTTTAGVPRRSPGRKLRPARSGIPITRK